MWGTRDLFWPSDLTQLERNLQRKVRKETEGRENEPTPTRQAENTFKLGTQGGLGDTLLYEAAPLGPQQGLVLSSSLWLVGRSAVEKGWMRSGRELQDPLGDSSPHLIRGDLQSLLATV